MEKENATPKRLLADAELEKAALKEIARGEPLSPARRRAAVDMLQGQLGPSQRRAAGLVGQHRSTQRHTPLVDTPADPDAPLRAELRAFASKHPRCGHSRALVHVREQGYQVNQEKVQRL